jgi:hypothetical protein
MSPRWASSRTALRGGETLIGVDIFNCVSRCELNAVVRLQDPQRTCRRMKSTDGRAHADRKGVRVLTVGSYEAENETVCETSALTRCQDTASQCGLML